MRGPHRDITPLPWELAAYRKIKNIKKKNKRRSSSEMEWTVTRKHLFFIYLFILPLYLPFFKLNLQPLTTPLLDVGPGDLPGPSGGGCPNLPQLLRCVNLPQLYFFKGAKHYLQMLKELYASLALEVTNYLPRFCHGSWRHTGS